jgi:integrase
MRDTRHLWLRHNVYYLRLAIPPALREHFRSGSGKPKDKIVEPLGTGDLRQAQALRNQRLVYWASVFQRIRSGGALSSEEIAEEARRVYVWTVAKMKEAEPVDAGLLRTVDQALEDREIQHGVGRDIAQIATARGVTIEPKTDTWRQLGRALIQAMCAAKGLPLPAALVINTANVLGEVKTETALLPYLPQSVPPGDELFSEALAAHLADLERAEIAPATLAGYRKQGDAFVSFSKDAFITKITRAMASDFLDHLVKERGIANQTVNQYAALLAAVIECARRRGRFESSNPFANQKRKAIIESHQPFTAEELSRLFASAKFETKPTKYGTQSALPWAAAIAAYSGCRREEIAQLRVQDLRKIDGIWCFDITPEAGRLKNRSAKRVVPVHSQLITAGLLKYHAALPRDASRLFPGLPARASKGGKVGAALGEVFESWRKSVGLTRPHLTFHSFRHGVASTLERAGVPETDAARALGHKLAGMSFGTYSAAGPGLIRLRDIIEKIGYPGFRLAPPPGRR